MSTVADPAVPVNRGMAVTRQSGEIGATAIAAPRIDRLLRDRIRDVRGQRPLHGGRPAATGTPAAPRA
ncbi:hypothetical protein ABZ297_44940, partial [Nonomuraea sp. NPDC005983]|uniref:hypothetical protein n=1 Tax=Nonomuraea sp. NPDC005983 TaxID=3155595 RepID=UPI0033BBEBB0